jgi:hypothetical protein
MNEAIEQLEALQRDFDARADAITKANGRVNPEAFSLMEISTLTKCLIHDVRVHNRNYPEG